jgi:nucleoside-diphosphate kinase
MFQPTREQIDGHYPKDEAWIRRLGGKTLGTYEKYGIDPVKDLGTNDDLELGKMVRGWLVDYMVSAPLVRMVVEGIHAVDMVRKICGATLPYMADMGTIRGDYSADSPAVANSEHRAVANLVHASETTTEAEHEIEHWFGGRDVIFSYERLH